MQSWSRGLDRIPVIQCFAAMAKQSEAFNLHSPATVWITVRAFINASFVTQLSIARGAVAQDVDACVALEREEQRHRPDPCALCA
jgi:hypothetical protein